MPVMNFDLEDGKPPVTFTLKESDTVRFVAFMAECNRALSKQQTEAAKPVVPESFTPNPAAGIHPVRIIRELIDSHKRDTHGQCDESCDIVAGMEAALHAVNEAQVQSCFDSILAPPLPVAQEAPAEPEFTDYARAALLHVLWHHQGYNSPVGQPIRFALGMGRGERLSDVQVEQAKRYGQFAAPAPPAAPKEPT